ncbi:MAG: molybdenum cofactor biosynthesis protein [Pseudomonadota bacterium]|jgi:molybdenum cofactor biosynthesis protein B
MSNSREFLPLRMAILTISDTRHQGNDLSGNLLVDLLHEAGHLLASRDLVKDDKYAIRATLSRWILDPGIDVIISTGGTGVTGRDGTPEAALPLFDKVLDGFGELFRAISFQEIGTSTLQSRTVAGVANGTYIFCLPGSGNACRTAWQNIIRQQCDLRTRPCNLVELLPRLTEK